VGSGVGRHLYRPWEARLAASGAVVGVEFRVDAELPGPTCVTGLSVARVLGRHYRVTSIRVGAVELLRRPLGAVNFAADCERPSLMFSATRGTVVSVSAVKDDDVPVPFVCVVRGMLRVE
jgi:hypothetical protein